MFYKLFAPPLKPVGRLTAVDVYKIVRQHPKYFRMVLTDRDGQKYVHWCSYCDIFTKENDRFNILSVEIGCVVTEFAQICRAAVHSYEGNKFISIGTNKLVSPGDEFVLRYNIILGGIV